MAGPRPRDWHPATKQSFADMGVTKLELGNEGDSQTDPDLHFNSGLSLFKACLN